MAEPHSEQERMPHLPGSERRASVRQLFHWDMACRLTGPERSRLARVRDISADGICLLLETPFEAGTLLEVELSGGESLSYKLAMRVCRTQELADGHWLIGCSFIGGVSDRPDPLTSTTASGLSRTPPPDA